MKKEYNIEKTEKLYTTHGQIIKNYFEKARHSENMSSIYSHLIKEAGAHCENYSSDLFYEYEAIENYLNHEFFDENENMIEKSFIIGFRKYGVDSKKQIENKMNSSCYGDMTKEYKSIRIIEFENDSEYESFFNINFYSAKIIER